MAALAKVSVEKVSVATILFTQNLFALLFSLPFVIGQGIGALRTKKIALHCLRAVTGLLSYGCLFLAVKYISLVNATLLANAAPLFLPFVIRIWLGTRIAPRLWASILMGYAGVLFILNPSASILSSGMVFVALLGSLFSAIALQAVKNLTSTDSSINIIFYYFLFASIATLPFFLFEGNFSFDLRDWLLLVAIGASLALTQFFLAKAYTFATPTLLGPFNYTVVIFAGLIGWWVWGRVPGLMECIGILLVSIGGILTILMQKRKSV